MNTLGRKTPFILLIGDIVICVVALWLTLLIRYQVIPDSELFFSHLVPFLTLFLLWVLSYFIAGLYERSTAILRASTYQTLLYAQLANAALAVGFFYFYPTSITPKTNLLLYFFVSTLLIFGWRAFVYRFVIREKREEAIVIGSGSELKELKDVGYSQVFDLDAPSQNLEKDVKAIVSKGASMIVIDLSHPKVQGLLPELYNLLLSKIRFIDIHQVYESVFNRVALTLVTHSWFLENISASPKHVYDIIKRVMDFTLAGVGSLVSLVVYPFVYVAIKLDDMGPVFVVQERIGKDNKVIKLLKFRSMRASDKGVWVKEGDDRITRVGKFIRKTRIDELPQLFSVVKGDMSLVGPRPDIYDLGLKLSEEIPYYTLRTIIKPGLSGWAQIRQELPPQSLEETKVRLAYDFYYIKHRSLFLDIKIALQTIATLLSRSGK
jgi:exopolysaccharide biosynthesis polyprenyl glycosylphosphotransferase